MRSVKYIGSCLSSAQYEPNRYYRVDAKETFSHRGKYVTVTENINSMTDISDSCV